MRVGRGRKSGGTTSTGGATPPPATQVAQSLSPSDFTTNDSFTGSLGFLVASGGLPDSYTYADAGANAGLVSTNAVTGEVTVASPITAGTYSIDFTATNSAGVATFTRSLVVQVTGAAFTPLGSVRVRSASASSQSNVPIEFRIPFDDDEFTSSQRIVMSVGGTRLTVQEDNRTTDASGAIRGVSVTAILPTLPAMGASGYTDVVYGYETGTPATGTSKTAAQVLALLPDLGTEVITNDGTERSAKLRTGLGASTSWTYKSPRLRNAKWKNGAICQTFVCDVPFTTVGGVADSHLMCRFVANCYSTDGFATISSVKVDYKIVNGWIDISGCTYRHYSLVVNVGISSPVTQVSYTNSTPAVALNITGTGSVRVCTTSPLTPGTFTTNDQGKTITKGTEHLKIVYVYPDGSKVEVFNAGLVSSSFASGAWTLWGMSNGFQTQTEGSVWYGTHHQYKVCHQRSRVLSTKTLLNHDVPSTEIASLLAATVSSLAAQGTHPSVIYRAPGTTTVLATRRHQTNEPDAIAYPECHISGCLVTDSDGYQLETGYDAMRRYAELWYNVHPITWNDSTTGLPVHWDTRPTWKDQDNSTYTGTHLSPVINDTAHFEECAAVLYALYGQFNDMEIIHRHLVYCWGMDCASDDRLFNTGGNQRFRFQARQYRGQAWLFNGMVVASFYTPDTMSAALLPHTKTPLRTWCQHNQTQAKLMFCGSPNGWSQETPAGPANPTTQPFYYEQGESVGWKQWYIANMCLVLKRAKEFNELTANGLTYTGDVYRNIYDCFIRSDVLSLEASPTIARRKLNGIYDSQTFATGLGSYPDWPAFYAIITAVGPNGTYANRVFCSHLWNYDERFTGEVADQEELLQWDIDENGTTQAKITVTGSPAIPDVNTWRAWHSAWEKLSWTYVPRRGW